MATKRGGSAVGGGAGAKLVLYPLALMGALYAGGQAYTAATGRQPAFPWGAPGGAAGAGTVAASDAAARERAHEEAKVEETDREGPETHTVPAGEHREHKKDRKHATEPLSAAETDTVFSPTPSSEMRAMMPGERLPAETDPATMPVPGTPADPKLEVTPARTGGSLVGPPADPVTVRVQPSPDPAGPSKLPAQGELPATPHAPTARRGAPAIAGPHRPGLPDPSILPGPAHAVPAVEIVRGEGRRREVALTFDAGADYRPAQKILDTLKANGLQSTFFLTGEWVEKNPKTTRRIAADGHEIGNHSWNHPAFTTLSDADIKDQLERTEAVIEQTTGKSSRPYFRPPLGARDTRVRRVVAGEGFYTIYWTLDSHDSVIKGITAEQVRDRVLEKAAAGSIILLHCGSQASAEALPEIIAGLKAKGLTPVPVSRLLAE